MQEDSRAARPARRGAAINGYLLSWTALAAFSLGYLCVAAARPDLLSAILPLAEGNSEHASAGRQSADLVDEITTLRKWVNDLQHEVIAAKAALQAQSAQTQSLAQRMSAAEDRLVGPAREARAEAAAPSPAPVAAAQPAARNVAKAQPRGQGKADAARAEAASPAVAAAPAATAPAEPIATAALEAPPGGTLKVINGEPASTITTGSVTPPAAAAATPPASPAPPAPAASSGFSAPKVTPAPPQQQFIRGIEIASSDSLDGLRSRWGELTARNGDVLQRLTPRYRISADGGDSPFTLLAGPFTSNDEARRACANLRSKGIDCRVGEFRGNAF